MPSMPDHTVAVLVLGFAISGWILLVGGVAVIAVDLWLLRRLKDDKPILGYSQASAALNYQPSGGNRRKWPNWASLLLALDIFFVGLAALYGAWFLLIIWGLSRSHISPVG